jgi:23S rRNA pseudouridine955/2504/2580 synthase
MSPKLSTHVVASDDDGIRLDRWFRRHFPVLGHGALQKLLRTGQVRVNGKRAEASTRVEAGQDIRVPPAATAVPSVSAIIEKKSAKKISTVPRALRDADQLKKYVLFEDDDVIVLNKPAGLAVQGGTGLKENIDDMLAVFEHRKHGKPKLVHRLDRDTSGVLLVARSASVAAKLSESFRNRSTQKIYWAITCGVPLPEQGRIEAPLIKKGELMTIAKGKADMEEAKNAITLYQVMESAKRLAAFVAMWPITGRTHQLRVHMAAVLGTPLLGDPLYGGTAPDGFPIDETGQGLHLHARRLIIPHPRHGVIDVTAPLGKEILKTWRWFGFEQDADADFSEA